ncbi:hypothetical protein Pcac1_g26959 [Phytophthora cactorum]|nr:hypothetical protein Pcac1_g26959 [Phytophthora cactorum]
MRFHYVVLLAASPVFASIDPVWGGGGGQRTPSFRFLHSGVRVGHSLRTKSVTANEDGEERAVTMKPIPGLQLLKNIPGLENRKKVFKSKITPGTYLKWAKQGKPGLRLLEDQTRQNRK